MWDIVAVALGTNRGKATIRKAAAVTSNNKEKVVLEGQRGSRLPKEERSTKGSNHRRSKAAIKARNILKGLFVVCERTVKLVDHSRVFWNQPKESSSQCHPWKS